MRPTHKILLFVIVLVIGTIALSHRKPIARMDDPDPFHELMLIQDAYASAPGVWSTWVYDFYNIDDDTATTWDFKLASLRNAGVRFNFSMDSILSLQDSRYNVTLYNDDSVMYVRSPVDLYKTLLQVDLLDTLLHTRQFHNISFSTYDNLKIITFEFENESPYIKYEIGYDSCSYMLEYVEYTMKKSVVPAGESYIQTEDYHDYIMIQVSSLGYEIGVQDENYFATGQYMKRQSQSFKGVGSYVNYAVVDASED